MTAAAALPFRRVAIVGVGLIGGSIAARLKQRAPATHIIGIDSEAVLDRASACGWIDEPRAGAVGRSEVESSAVEDLHAELIVLAAPVEATVAWLERQAASLPGGGGALPPIVTDTCSVKRPVMDAAARVPRFVGGHPMAGSEHSGIDHADPNLFEGRSWLLVAGDAMSEHARAVADLVTVLGASPVFVDAAWHDRVMAYVSHLPQLVAIALMNATGEACGEAGLSVAGRAFREMTRLAASPSDFWDGILRNNSDNVRAALADLTAHLPLSPPETAALHAAFERARAWQDKLPPHPQAVP